MGDPKKLRKRYSTPTHPWQKSRIEEEKELIRNYGLKNKKEAWKMVSMLKHFYGEAKRLIASRAKQSEVESERLLNKLISYNFLKPNAQINDILEITIKDLMERRLQTIITRKGYARSVKQARQFITHGHVTVNGIKMTSPSYLVREKDLANIEFNETSAFADLEHPERMTVEVPVVEEKVEE